MSLSLWRERVYISKHVGFDVAMAMTVGQVMAVVIALGEAQGNEFDFDTLRFREK